MWYFAIPEVIKELHEDPEFSAARGQGRTFDKPGSFWGSPEFERLDKATHKAITRDGASVCEWGFDFGQVFTFIQHSSGFLFYRWVNWGFIVDGVVCIPLLHAVHISTG